MMSARERTYRGFTITNRQGRRIDWFVSYHGRTRWGTLEEIKADVDNIFDYGHLPTGKHLWA